MSSGQSSGERANGERATSGAHPDIDGGFAWVRLAAGLALGTIGGVGMWSFAVALPAVQAEFGVSRGSASLPYAAIMLGFGFGGILMGRLSDRVGIFTPVLIGAVILVVVLLRSILLDILVQYRRLRLQALQAQVVWIKSLRSTRCSNHREHQRQLRLP
jgi:MFS family permease